MKRIAIAVVLSALVAACGQQAPATGEAGAPVGELDYIDAVPIDENAPPPVAEPQTAAKKEEPEAEDTEEAKAEEAEVAPAVTPSAPARPASAAPANDAASATRRANEAVAPRSATEVPYSPN